jgi:hypothetical protein
MRRESVIGIDYSSGGDDRDFSAIIERQADAAVAVAERRWRIVDGTERLIDDIASPIDVPARPVDVVISEQRERDLIGDSAELFFADRSRASRRGGGEPRQPPRRRSGDDQGGHLSRRHVG